MPEGILEYPIYATGEPLRIHVRAEVARVRSRYQEIHIVDSVEFGRCLLLDGCIQCAESDHLLYDDALLASVRGEDGRLLVLGGGDGYIARRAVERWPKVEVTVVEIDAEVARLSAEHLTRGVFAHARVRLEVCDALEYLGRATRRGGEPRYSGVVVDLTDVPVVTGPRRDDHAAFFAGILEHCHAVLGPDGWISLQAGVPAVTKDYLDLPPLLTGLLARGYGDIRRCDVMVPSYGEPNVFLFARARR